MNGKFLTKLLDTDYRNQFLLKNSKFTSNNEIQLNQYATYVVDKHAKDRKMEFKESREFYYGFDPIDIISYCANDGSIKKFCFEFKTVNHFLHKNNRLAAVDVVKCILIEIARENKAQFKSFNIEQIDADAKMLEKQYAERANTTKQIEENNK